MEGDKKSKSKDNDSYAATNEGDVSGFVVGATIPTSFGPIYEWLPVEENVPKHASVIAFGKRRTGKSTTFINLAEKLLRDFPFGIVMSSTAYSGFWQNWVPPRFVIQDLQAHLMIALKKRQKKLIKQYGKEDPRTHAFIIFDDVIADQKAMRWNKEIASFFVEGRHQNISVWITSQHVKGLGPMLRGNADIIIFQPIYNRNSRVELYDLYGGIMERKDFYKLMDEVVVAEYLPDHTERDPRMKVRTMIVRDTYVGTDIAGRFFWYVPVHHDEVAPFKLCHPAYWKEDVGGFGNEAREKRRDIVDLLDDVTSSFALVNKRM